MPKDKKERIFILFCIVCALLGAALRFVNIGVPLSFDETFTVITADGGYSLGYILKEFLIPDVHPPLYNIIMHFWSVIFPAANEAVIRVPSLIFAFAALFAGWFYYPKGRDLAEKYIFTAFLSVSTIIIYTSVDARSYSLVLLLSVLLTFLTLNMAGKISKGVTPSKKELAGYFILTLLATYTHYVGAITAGAQTLVLLGYAFHKKRGFWQIAALYFLVIVLILPWIYLQGRENLGNLNGLWWNTIDTFWARSVTNVIATFTMGAIPGLFIWAGSLYALFVIGRKDKKALTDVFIILPVLTLIISLGVMLALLPKINFFLGRLVTALLPPVFIIFAFFMNYAAKKRKIFMLTNAAALCVALYTSGLMVFLGHEYTGGPKNVARFLLDNYPRTRHELFYVSSGGYKKADALIAPYYFRMVGGKPPEKTHNVFTPEGAAAFSNASGVTPIWFFRCGKKRPKEIAAVYGDGCVGVYDMTLPGEGDRYAVITFPGKPQAKTPSISDKI